MSALIFSFLAAAFRLLSWQLASHVQQEVGKHLKETLYQKYPFTSLQLAFPLIRTPQVTENLAFCTLQVSLL